MHGTNNHMCVYMYVVTGIMWVYVICQTPCMYFSSRMIRYPLQQNILNEFVEVTGIQLNPCSYKWPWQAERTNEIIWLFKELWLSWLIRSSLREWMSGLKHSSGHAVDSSPGPGDKTSHAEVHGMNVQYSRVLVPITEMLCYIYYHLQLNLKCVFSDVWMMFEYDILKSGLFTCMVQHSQNYKNVYKHFNHKLCRVTKYATKNYGIRYV